MHTRWAIRKTSIAIITIPAMETIGLLTRWLARILFPSHSIGWLQAGKTPADKCIAVRQIYRLSRHHGDQLRAYLKLPVLQSTIILRDPHYAERRYTLGQRMRVLSVIHVTEHGFKHGSENSCLQQRVLWDKLILRILYSSFLIFDRCISI